MTTIEQTLAGLRAQLIEAKPVLVVIAGPNGAGKTTLYRTRLAALGLPFVNADEIALALRTGQRAAPRQWARLDADAAAQRIADRDRELRLELNESFMTETVFSDPVGAKLAWLARAKQHGFDCTLIFIGISDPVLSEARVLERVRTRGGHDVPRAKLYERFPRTLANLARAVPIADTTLLIDNDDDRVPYRPVGLMRLGRPVWRAGRLPRWLPPPVRAALQTIRAGRKLS